MRSKTDLFHQPAAEPRRSRRLVVAVAVAVIFPLFAAPPAAALPATSSPTVSQLADSQSTDHLPADLLAEMRRQEALQPAIDLLHAEMHHSKAIGFTSVGFEGDGLAVYWKGTMPPSMLDGLANVRKLATVRVRAAAYSKQELDDAIDTVTAATGLSSNIQAVFAKHDGSGLEVLRMSPTESTEARSAFAAGGRPLRSVDDILATLDLKTPTTITDAATPVTRAACAGACTRLNDQPAWNGGTRLYIPVSRGLSECTSGFGVRLNSQTFLLTASHCANVSNVFYDTTWERIGGVYADNWGYDIMLVNARGYHRIFDGNPSTSYSKAVKSSGWPASNELLCQSGSSSGTVCNLKTMGNWGNVFDCDSDGDCFNMYDMYYAIQMDNRQSAIGGDSGGPVFSLDGTGVRAKGITNGYSGTYGEFFFYQDWPTINSLFGVNVVTG